MKKNRLFRTLFLAGALLALLGAGAPAKWGFFGHRRLNRLAVFTLPPGMIGFYKKHIEYLTEHAVDPDKRRYATRHEAPRHFLDLDRYGTFPFDHIPRRWAEACARFSDVYVITPDSDTLLLVGYEEVREEGGRWLLADTLAPSRRYWPAEGIDKKAYLAWFTQRMLPQFYEEEWRTSCDSLKQVFGVDFPCTEVIGIDTFSAHGVLPYNLVQVQRRLTEAFHSGNVPVILRQSAELGHYIGDAHVPLHTTENYNGQLTGQLGIHAFWESRIPELFADQKYDYFVGPAAYIPDVEEYYWNMVFDSHRLVDSVLLIEKQLSLTFPPDKQYCYEERLGATIRTQCKEYAAAYQDAMKGMVERRWRETIKSIGSAWYTAWVDAGQPDLLRLNGAQADPLTSKLIKEMDAAFKKGQAFGRPHE